MNHPLFSKIQVLILIHAPTIPCIISFISSSLIIYMLLCIKHRRSNNNKKWNIYHRLLLSMSVIDMISSVNLSLSNIMLPHNDINPPYIYDLPSYGNTSTCTVQGFLGQFIVIVALYNLSLCIYFKLVIVNQWNERKVMKYRIEWYMHIVSLGYPLLLGGIGLYYEAYNPLLSMPGWCYLADSPFNCSKNNDNVDCIRGKYGLIIKKYAFVVPITITIIGICICMIQIYWKVRTQERRMIQRYHFAHYNNNTMMSRRSQQSSITNIFSTTNNNYDNVNDNNRRNNNNDIIVVTDTNNNSNSLSNNNNHTNNNNNNQNNQNATMNIGTNYYTNNEEILLSRTTQSSIQAKMYAMAFIISFLTPYIKILTGTNYNDDNTIKISDESVYKIIQFISGILQTTLLPLQGLWNLLIYTRPSCYRYMKRYPNCSRLNALWATLNGQEYYNQQETLLQRRSSSNNNNNNSAITFWQNQSSLILHSRSFRRQHSSFSISSPSISTRNHMPRRPAIYIPELDVSQLLQQRQFNDNNVETQQQQQQQQQQELQLSRITLSQQQQQQQQNLLLHVEESNADQFHNDDNDDDDHDQDLKSPQHQNEKEEIDLCDEIVLLSDDNHHRHESSNDNDNCDITLFLNHLNDTRTAYYDTDVDSNEIDNNNEQGNENIELCTSKDKDEEKVDGPEGACFIDLVFNREENNNDNNNNFEDQIMISNNSIVEAEACSISCGSYNSSNDNISLYSNNTTEV